jgi:hypothetical protein
MRPVHPESVLLMTLDSCRFDTAQRTHTPALDRVGPMHEAMAPAHFTLASHAAIWVGTTPGVPGLGQPVLDPKAGRLFRLTTPSIGAGPGDVFALEGATLIEGFRRRGYLTLGCGAVDWFDPETAAGQRLSGDFERFRFFRRGDVAAQVRWTLEQLPRERPVLAFLNIGETHVPYWHRGASWDYSDNPCRPYQHETNRREVCVERQSACLRYIDSHLSDLISAFLEATILITADHGDAWGEDGLWEHGTWHPAIMRVPLWVRVRGQACTG